jgi:RHS repeat-associated protein
MILDAAARSLFSPALASRAGRRFIVRGVLAQQEHARHLASSPSRRRRPAAGCRWGSGSRRGLRPARWHLRRGSECRKSLQAPGSDRVKGRGRGGPLFDGQYTSSDTGLVYLRNRVYDPTTAQFLSVDPLEAITGAPYNYAGDNSVNYSDPTGLIFGIPGTPSWEEVGEGVAGWGDTITFGVTKKIREAIGDENVDTCSGAYQGGGDAGLATGALIPGEDEVEGAELAEVGANDLSEQLALEEAQAGAGTRIMEGQIGDPDYPEDLWAKMQHVHENPDGSNTVIHYWENLETGLREGFKFK